MQQPRIKTPTQFPHFRHYCQTVAPILSQHAHFYSEYKKLSHPLLRDHDAEYLLIEHTDDHTYIKINILYSLAFQIPVLYFMVYGYEVDRHYRGEELGEKYRKLGAGTVLDGRNVDTGIFISQNPLTKEYMFTLHGCQLGMPIQLLVPFYLNLLQLYPEIVLPQSYYAKKEQKQSKNSS